LGRIAAQAAKQVLVQKVREAESEKIFGSFSVRIGEIVTGTYRRLESGALILDVNDLDVVLPPSEMIPGETYDRGAQIRAVIVQVRRGLKGQDTQIIVSRTSPAFLERLLLTEIPEIASGVIEIKAIVRQPGERSKVAVSSRERDVDPIGACIGVKGSRILAISKELGGEKIDIVVWAANPGLYAKSALGRSHQYRRSVAGSHRRQGSTLPGHRKKRHQRQVGLQTHRLEDRHPGAGLIYAKGISIDRNQRPETDSQTGPSGRT
jgi:N utilization substance protein A